MACLEGLQHSAPFVQLNDTVRTKYFLCFGARRAVFRGVPPHNFCDWCSESQVLLDVGNSGGSRFEHSLGSEAYQLRHVRVGVVVFVDGACGTCHE